MKPMKIEIEVTDYGSITYTDHVGDTTFFTRGDTPLGVSLRISELIFKSLGIVTPEADESL